MHINDKYINNEKINYLKEYDNLQKIYNEIRRDDFGNYICLRETFLRLFRNYRKRGTCIDYNEFERRYIPNIKREANEETSFVKTYIEYDDFCIYIEFLLEASTFLHEMDNGKKKNLYEEEIWKNVNKQLYFLNNEIDNLIELMQCEIKEIEGFKNIIKKKKLLISKMLLEIVKIL